MFTLNQFSSLFLACIVTSAACAQPNLVRVCLDIDNNQSQAHFRTGFYSTDFFDDGSATRYIQNGRICQEHLYKHGPKNLTVWVKGSQAGYGQPTTITLDKTSCENFYTIHNSSVYKSYRTSNTKEFWNFRLIQTDYLVFNLICERQS
ncbi:MAG: hypothetical protein H0W64_05095 [Gammaproteobacteria bacterium]|nr:hypothetical protein [Gammaproteobacteria bacterium]